MFYSDEDRKDETNLVNILSDMKKYASIYQHFVNNDDEEGEIAELHREIFGQFNSPALAIPLMYFYNLMNGNDITEEEYMFFFKEK